MSLKMKAGSVDMGCGTILNTSSLLESDVLIEDMRNRQIYEKYMLKGYLIDQALQYSKTPQYKRVVMYQDGGNDRNVERDMIQNDANIVVLRKDCIEANFADYVPSAVDHLYDGMIDLRFDSIARSGRHDSSRVSLHNYSIDNNVCIEMSQKKPTVVEELVSNGMSPVEVAKLSDLFEHPTSFRDVGLSMIPWLQEQRKTGYWTDHTSLFILCLTIAMSVGSLETIFKLNTTWDGMIFLLTYFLSYLFVVQPIICFELTIGQLFRASQSSIYDKLVKGCGGIGTAMVLLCVISGCVACSRIAAEYLLYFIDVLNRNIPWKMTQAEIDRCIAIGNDIELCENLSPLCSVVDDKCVANALGKAYLAYQEKFDPVNVDMDTLNNELVCAIIGTYAFVAFLQFIGLTNFTFSAFLLLILVLFLTHMQLYCTMILEGASNYLWNSFRNWEFKYLYTNSRIWTHSIRCCLYEYIIGNGIYSTLASKSRIGYDLSAEAVGVGLCSGYITMLLFITAAGLIGFYSKALKTLPTNILSMIEQDCSFILLPLGFQTTKSVEHTLCVLQFGCSCILVAATLAIQVEVAIMSIKEIKWFKKIDRKYISTAVCAIFMIISIPLCTRNGKRIIWFLEIAVGDLGRVFMVFMTCLVAGWFYGTEQQIKNVGRTCLYTFNGIFWSANIGVSIAEALDERVPLLIWWSIRLGSLVVAAIAGIFLAKGPNGKSSTLWWLFFGNIEEFRAEITRITPMNKVGSMTMTLLWSISIKWISICFLSSSLADIIEEMISKDNIVNLNNISNKCKIITLAIWAIFIVIIVLYPLIKSSDENKVIDLKELPTCPHRQHILVHLGPRNLFKEFYGAKADDKVKI